MLVSVREYAQVAGVQPRTVRLRAASGVLDAYKIGGVWLIDDAQVREDGYRRPGCGVSIASFERIAAYLDGCGSKLSASHRYYAKKEAGRIIEDPLRELRRLSLSRGSDLFYFRGSHDLPHGRMAGLCAEGHDFSPGKWLDVYVCRDELEKILLQGLLIPSERDNANVIIRVVDEYPPCSRLRLWCDLLDYGSARISAWVSEQAAMAAEEARRD